LDLVTNILLHAQMQLGNDEKKIFYKKHNYFPFK